MALYRGRLNDITNNINGAEISSTWIAMRIARMHLVQICLHDIYESILSGTGRTDVRQGGSETADWHRVVALDEPVHPQKRDQCLSVAGTAGQ